MKNLTIFCKDFELTDAIKTYLADKMMSLEKYLNRPDEVTFNARLGKVSNHHNHGKIFYAEISIHTPDKNFGGREEAEELYEAIDILKDELARSLTHYKSKTRALARKEAKRFKEEIRTVTE
jgi:ribosomal subunit interface protein